MAPAGPLAMAIGDVTPVTAGGVEDVHVIDTGIFDLPAIGAVYVVDAERPAIVDSGIGTNHERVLAGLEDLGIDAEELAVIALTHVHLDHAGGAGFLAEACPAAEVLIHSIGAPHLVDPGRLVEGTKRAVGEQWAYYTEPLPVPAERVTEIEGGDAIDLGDRTLAVHHAPGHAPHQVVFHDADRGIVFTGDAAGNRFPALDRITPTTPPPNFDLEGSLADLEMLQDLDPAVLCYGHFGGAPAGDRLAEYADVLIDWVDAVADAREALGDEEAVVEHFVEREDLSPAVGDWKAGEEIRMNVAGVLRYLDSRDG